MKKSSKIILAISLIFVVLLLVSLLTKGGRLFWNEAIVVPVLKPFSEACGYNYYDGTEHITIECGCDGLLLEDINTGPTTYYCFGERENCECFSSDSPQSKGKEVDCAKYPDLGWSYTN